MLFNSYCFIFAFLPVTAIVFGILSHLGWRTASFAWLIACSMFFYAFWSPRFLALLLVSLTINYLIGTIWLGARGPRVRKAGLIVGLVFNLAVLAYFKYAGFLIGAFDSVLGKNWSLGPIILPLGISFFTFQKIAYLVDTYKGRGYSRNFLYYCLMVLFFPQLIAGPIVHPREVLPQFARRRVMGITAKNVAVGLTLFFLGLCKKVLIADSISPTANRVFGAAAAGAWPDMQTAWLGTLAYTLQIYFDFSGYTDMALGLARIFGFRLPVNFNSPYQAHSIIDFWHRWHMTLSRFLREYLYIPLGGNRRGKFRRYLNLMITMLLGGLWHGANWTFVAWGGLHGIYLVINHGFRTANKNRSKRIWAVGLTFVSVAVAWVLFRAPDFPTAGRMIAGLCGYHGMDLHQAWIDRSRWIALLGLLAFVFWAPNSQHVMSLARPALGVLPPAPDERRGRLLWRPDLFWAASIAIVAIVSILYLSRASEFIYYQF
jgi:alginate O-acetyltransferase complex protein AlgI